MTELLLILVILTNLRLLATGRMASYIMWVAVQGVLLGFLAIAAHWTDLSGETLVIAVGAILLKGWAFPKLMFRTLHVIGTSREVQPYVGFVSSLVIGMAALSVSLWLGSRLSMPGELVSQLIVPASLFAVFNGLFLMISRKNAVAQVVGYLVLENGAYTLGVGALQHTPFLVEIGVLLDLLVAVFLMSMMIHNIHRAFSHIDTHELRRLRG